MDFVRPWEGVQRAGPSPEPVPSFAADSLCSQPAQGHPGPTTEGGRGEGPEQRGSQMG